MYKPPTYGVVASFANYLPTSPNPFHTTNWRLYITSKVQHTGYFTAASVPPTVNTLRQHACIFIIANTHSKSHLQLSLKHNVIHPQNDNIPVQCSFVTISMSTLQLPWSSEKNLTSIIRACCCFRKMVHLKSRAVTLIIGKLQSPWRPYEISWASPLHKFWFCPILQHQ